MPANARVRLASARIGHPVRGILRHLFCPMEENMSFRPLHDRILVRRVESQEKTKGGIIIPDTAKEKPQEGKVVALGTGKVNEDGKKVEFTVKKGDKVLIS